MSGQTAGQIEFRPDRLKAELDRLQWRPAHVAVHLDVDPRTVTRWCSGEVEPNGSNARRLARLFDRHPDYFFDPLDEAA